MEPENLGDSHLRLLLKNSDNYSVDNDLVKMFIKAYFNLLWDQDNDLSSRLQVHPSFHVAANLVDSSKSWLAIITRPLSLR